MVLRLPRREAPRAGPFQAADGDQDGDGHGDGDMGSGVRSSTNLIPQPRNERSVFRRSKPSGLTRAGRPPSSGSHSSHANVAQGSRAAAVAAKPSMASAVGPRQTGQPARTPVVRSPVVVYFCDPPAQQIRSTGKQKTWLFGSPHHCRYPHLNSAPTMAPKGAIVERIQRPSRPRAGCAMTR